jgi:hypothetical protein
MKTIIISIILLCGIIITGMTGDNKKDTALVEQMQGVYIFILSKPAAEYNYIGSCSKSFALTGGPEEMLNSMLKKCKKDFPTADGLIFKSLSMDKADAVKFK